ncbi:MAG: thermostable hemolysin [Halioglobus sp.]
MESIISISRTNSVPKSPEIRSVRLRKTPLLTSFPRSTERASIESYIARIFLQSYGAEISEYMPLLCSLRRKNEHTAALGLRGAATSELFCERYFDEGVDQKIENVFGQIAYRSQIMELGNLASTLPGEASRLYLLVVRALALAGVDFLVFAANRAVRHSIRRCGFETREICNADPMRMGDKAVEWGTYYNGNPKVIFADIPAAVKHGENSPPIAELWRKYAADIAVLSEAIHLTRFSDKEISVQPLRSTAFGRTVV